MLKLVIFAGLSLAVWAATTIPPTAAPMTILYDLKHHKAMIVTTKGCFEYAMDHQDMIDIESDVLKQDFETRILQDLAMASNCEMMGHNHGNHFTAEIQTACASIPYFHFTDVDNSTSVNCP